MAESQFDGMKYEPFYPMPGKYTKHWITCRKCDKTAQWRNMYIHWDTNRDHDTDAVPEGYRYYKLTDPKDRTSAPIQIPRDDVDDDESADDESDETETDENTDSVENTESDDNKYGEDSDDDESEQQSDLQNEPNSIQSDAPEVRISVH